MAEPTMEIEKSASVEYRFVCTLLRTLARLQRPEALGIAVLTSAAECGIKRDEALALMRRFMIEVTLPKEWRPWTRKPGALK